MRQGAFSAITFTPKKMAVISTFTREIAEHSTPAIEGLIRQAIVEDTAVAIDSVLLDATAATTTRPAGLKAGVSATTATAGGGIAAVIGDIRGLTGALITGTNGNLRSPVWIMNPAMPWRFHCFPRPRAAANSRSSRRSPAARCKAIR